MDCEKFDQHVIDALYDELDELTMASMKRHMEGCSRCASAFSALRATREVAILPLEEPSADLESRILFAASAAQRKTPWHRKALRALAWAGSHAMRPQLAMAAVFVLVIGSSLLLLRAKPGTTAIGPVRVTERGEPSPEKDEGQAAAATPPALTFAGDMPAPAAAPPAEVASRGAKDDGNGDGEKAEEKARAKGGDAQAALADATATESASGCDAALAKYEDVGVRFPGTTQAAAAMWAAASCHKKRGDASKARELYDALAQREEYKDKASEALNELAPASNSNQVPQASAVAGAATATTPAASQAPGGAGHAGAAAPVKAAAPAPKAPAAPPQAKPSSPQATEQSADPQAPGWGGGKGNASPVKRKAFDSAF